MYRNGLKLLGAQAEYTHGIVIGGDDIVGSLYYEGRKQGSTLYGSTDSELTELAKSELAGIKAECGAAFNDIYPDKSAWELRVYRLIGTNHRSFQ